MSTGKRIGWILFVIVILGAAGFAAAPYVTLDPKQSRVAVDPSFPLHYDLLIIHIFVSFIALVIGWLQFIPRLRTNHVRLHRFIGRIYLICVGIGGISGIIVGMFESSFVKQMAFWLLAGLWLFTSWRGYALIRQRNIQAHRIWITRSYAMTLVAASARVVTPLLILFYIAAHGVPEDGNVRLIIDQLLEVNIWVGLVINFFITEWILLPRFKKLY